MASGMVRGAINAVLEDEKFVQSPRSDKMRQFGKELLAKVIGSSQEIEAFDIFSQDIINQMEMIFTSIPKTVRFLSSKKAKCWSIFHEKR